MLIFCLPRQIFRFHLVRHMGALCLSVCVRAHEIFQPEIKSSEGQNDLFCRTTIHYLIYVMILKFMNIFILNEHFILKFMCFIVFKVV